MYVLYSTLLHLPPLRFHCAGGRWVRTQDSCDFGIGVRRSSHSDTSQKVPIPAGTEYSVVAADPGLRVPLQLESLEPEGLEQETSVVRTGGKPTH
jgi:hypothetical protein